MAKDCFTLGAAKAGTKHDPNWCSCFLVQFVLNLKILITKSRYFGGAIQSAFNKAFFTSQISKMILQNPETKQTSKFWPDSKAKSGYKESPNENSVGLTGA